MGFCLLGHGKKRALLIGINYIGTSNALNGTYEKDHHFYFSLYYKQE